MKHLAFFCLAIFVTACSSDSCKNSSFTETLTGCGSRSWEMRRSETVYKDQAGQDSSVVRFFKANAYQYQFQSSGKFGNYLDQAFVLLEGNWTYDEGSQLLNLPWDKTHWTRNDSSYAGCFVAGGACRNGQQLKLLSYSPDSIRFLEASEGFASSNNTVTFYPR